MIPRFASPPISHAGWFEFRLAVPADGGTNKQTPITQDLLNEHILEIDSSTPDYPKILNYREARPYSPSPSPSPNRSPDPSPSPSPSPNRSPDPSR